MKELCTRLIAGFFEKVFNKPLRTLTSYILQAKFSQISMIKTVYFIYSILFKQRR